MKVSLKDLRLRILREQKFQMQDQIFQCLQCQLRLPSDNESDFDEVTWSRNLHKPNVRDFNDTFGATFTLEDNQQENFFLINSFQDELIEKITRDKTLCYEMHKGEARSQMEANKCH